MRFCMVLYFLLSQAVGAIAQDEAEIQEYMKRVTDKAYVAENLIIGNVGRINYLLNILKDDEKHIGKSGNGAEKAQVKARIKHVTGLLNQSKKLQKAATKRVNQIDKANKLSSEELVEQIDDVKGWLNDIIDINKKVAELTESATQPLHTESETSSETITQVDPSISSPPVEVPIQITEQTDGSVNPDNQENTQPTGSTKYATYSRDKDVMLNPLGLECGEVKEEIDPFTGKNRRVTPTEELFHFTNTFMAGSLKDKQHITCYATVIEVKKVLYLNLKFVINDVNGNRNFGPIRKDVPILVKFVDETKLPLVNGLTDEGSMDESGSIYTVTAAASLLKTEKEGFARKEIDRIRIPWTKGYEEYEVFRVDLIQKLIKCL